MTYTVYVGQRPPRNCSRGDGWRQARRSQRAAWGPIQPLGTPTLLGRPGMRTYARSGGYGNGQAGFPTNPRQPFRHTLKHNGPGPVDGSPFQNERTPPTHTPRGLGITSNETRGAQHTTSLTRLVEAEGALPNAALGHAKRVCGAPASRNSRRQLRKHVTSFPKSCDCATPRERLRLSPYPKHKPIALMFHSRHAF